MNLQAQIAALGSALIPLLSKKPTHEGDKFISTMMRSPTISNVITTPLSGELARQFPRPAMRRMKAPRECRVVPNMGTPQVSQLRFDQKPTAPRLRQQ
jgi:hypothetical protein